jgi:hypothetical protein
VNIAAELLMGAVLWGPPAEAIDAAESLAAEEPAAGEAPSAEAVEPEAVANEADTPDETAAPDETPAPDETGGSGTPHDEAGIEPSVAPGDDELLTVAGGSGRDGPPYYTQAEEDELRARFGLDVDPPEDVKPARWRCLIADPTCGVSFEINATSAYAYRLRQGGVRDVDSHSWHSARVQYDFWLNLPVLVETSGNNRFSRITMGPKGGVMFSDSGDLWGNIGLATRYWLGRGRWAPSIEFTSALTFRMGSRPTREQYDAQGQPIEPEFRMTRGPAGFTADIAFGFGGFGAIVVGGQYDSPFAREDIPEIYRTPAAGMFFVGFRGNILWGGPAGAAVLTHVLAQRYAGPRI